MRLRLALLPIAIATLAPSLGRASDDFQAMFERREAEKEKVRCEQLVREREAEKQVEGHTCLAHLVLAADKPIQMPVRDRHGKTSLRSVPSDPATTAALGHLRAARKLAPGRILLHKEILSLTRRAMRLRELPDEYRQCIALVPRDQRSALLDQALLPSMYALTEDARHEEALAVGRVLEKEYPRNNQVVSNVGGALMSLGRDAEALRYLERAVALAPKDAVDRWNLGQYRGRQGKYREADQDFTKAVSLATKPEEKAELGCRHASFVLEALKDRRRACDLQKKHCPASVRNACEGT
jgi:tetratricopeptide (TPR) repeat protein